MKRACRERRYRKWDLEVWLPFKGPMFMKISHTNETIGAWGSRLHAGGADACDGVGQWLESMFTLMLHARKRYSDAGGCSSLFESRRRGILFVRVCQAAEVTDRDCGTFRYLCLALSVDRGVAACVPGTCWTARATVRLHNSAEVVVFTA